MKKIIIVLILSILSSISSYAQMSEIEKIGIKFSQLLYYIENLYVDTVNIEQLSDAAITTMLAELDPHSSYIPAKDVESMNEAIMGNFEGIGISYNFINDTVTVLQVISGCPAEKVGILPGDKITHVDGQNVAGVKLKWRTEIPKLIRGKKGSTVEVVVARRGEKKSLTFNVVRDKIPIYSVDAAYYVAPNIGYIKLNSFSATTTKEISDALEKLQKSGDMQSLILDLQSNGGGLMSAAIDLVNLFIPRNQLIVYTEGENAKRQDAVSTAGNKLPSDLNLTILIDEYSASASEITAGGLQDWDRATIVGRRSFGKGLVQRPLRMNDGSEVRLTVARYHTPSGRCIQKPYTEGKEKYYKDLETRYNHGELINSDSISFPDSLKYYTLKENRLVYGGGGIFPDIFVPLDTAKYTKYYRSIVAKGVFNTTVSKYVDSNRKKLERQYKTFEEYKERYVADEKILTEMVENATTEGIEYNEEEFELSKEMMMLQIKAVIAQSLFGTSSYYEISNINNDIIQRAIENILKRSPENSLK